MCIINMPKKYLVCHECKSKIYISGPNIKSGLREIVKDLDSCCKKVYFKHMNPSNWNDYGR